MHCIVWSWRGLTFGFLEDALHGAGAAAAGHCYVEAVLVFGHGVCWWRRAVAGRELVAVEDL